MKLIVEKIEESKAICEAKDDGKKYWMLEGVFMQAEVKNRNGRVYPRNVMESGVSRYMSEKMNNKTSYGELGHPQGPTINPDRISHIITDLHFEGNDVFGKAKIFDTTMGITAQKILEGGGRLGMSSRAMGSLKEQNGAMVVQEDFHIATAADIVTDPSAPKALVNGIMEDVEWVLENGIWSQKQAEQNIKIVKEASKANLDEAFLRVWNNFLSNI